MQNLFVKKIKGFKTALITSFILLIIFWVISAEAVDKLVNMWNNLSNKVSLDEIIKAVNNARRILRDYKKNIGRGRNRTNNEIK